MSRQDTEHTLNSHVDAEGLPEPAGMVQEPSVIGLPQGYRYGVTRYADIILRDAFPDRYHDLQDVLSVYRIDVSDF